MARVPPAPLGARDAAAGHAGRGGVAGFYNVCTLATSRRRGWASASVAFGLGLAAADGFETAVLQAAHDAIGVYERLGFEGFGEVVEHAWRPV